MDLALLLGVIWIVIGCLGIGIDASWLYALAKGAAPFWYRGHIAPADLAKRRLAYRWALVSHFAFLAVGLTILLVPAVRGFLDQLFTK